MGKPGSDHVQFRATLALVEAVDRQGGDVDRGWPAEEQVADDLADGGALQEAVAGEAGGVQQPGGLARLADQGVVVGGVLVQARPAAGAAQVEQGRGAAFIAA